jgi:hypothetical protein
MPVPCSHIQGPDLNKWYDDSCHHQHINRDFFGSDNKYNQEYFKEGSYQKIEFGKGLESHSQFPKKENKEDVKDGAERHKAEGFQNGKHDEQKAFYDWNTFGKQGQSYAYNKFFNAFPDLEKGHPTTKA